MADAGEMLLALADAAEMMASGECPIVSAIDIGGRASERRSQ
jgi:hypothetical protein